MHATVVFHRAYYVQILKLQFTEFKFGFSLNRHKVKSYDQEHNQMNIDRPTKMSDPNV